MSTAVVQEPVQPVVLGAVAGYGENNESMADIEASPLPATSASLATSQPTPDKVAATQSTLQPTPTKVYGDGESARARAQSTSSLGGSKPIPANRQADFEKLFGSQLPKPKGEKTPDDFLTVLQTQSADLQASVLLHGRLYLTRYHLCFRSNIMGYVTERVHDLRDIVWVERSTTAKWIQNAVSIGLDTELDDKVIGYGSMADREAMFTGLMEVWKERAPERYSQFLERRETKSAMDADLAGAGSRHRSATTATKSGVPHDIETAGRHRSATATAKLGQDKPTAKTEGGIIEEEEHGDEHADTKEGGPTETDCCGEHFDEVALDTALPVEINQLFELMYHNEEFGQDFLKNKQKLTDINTSDWTEKDGAKERTLKYVMHMNNYIGPKKSDCIGSERIEVEKPDKVYEIVSSTQTPDVPSGKSFKIHTRTCLTRTIADGNPSTRMYCTTQCDWSASSMLKSTITPAVIKGQKEYHQSWLSALKEWIDDHPDDFRSKSTGSTDESEKSKSDSPKQTTNAHGDKVIPLDSKTDVIPERSNAPIDTQVVAPASAIHESTDITKNQPMMIMLLVCMLSIALNVYLVSK